MTVRGRQVFDRDRRAGGGPVPVVVQRRRACGNDPLHDELIRLVAQGEGAAKCPSDSDGWLDAPGGSRTACLRNRLGPHPGDPGKGGGVLKAGDCTLIQDGDVQEHHDVRAAARPRPLPVRHLHPAIVTPR
ncbi:hypothetical protein [Nonomuraea sp. NPDC003201]